jgi:hypothetical protein
MHPYTCSKWPRQVWQSKTISLAMLGWTKEVTGWDVIRHVVEPQQFGTCCTLLRHIHPNRNASVAVPESNEE